METRKAVTDAGGAPSSWVTRHAAKIARGGRVLDLACGRGRHARWLASEGFAVLAVDRDASALAAMADVPAIETLCSDLESGAWTLTGSCFDGIVVTRYLHRPLLPQLVAALAPNGVLLYETFMLGNERFGRPSNPDFLLRPGELLALARTHGLEVLDFKEGDECEPAPATVQGLCARRPAAPSGARDPARTAGR